MNTEEIREITARLTDAQRVEWWKELQDGYCNDCGRKLKEVQFWCHCENDD